MKSVAVLGLGILLGCAHFTLRSGRSVEPLEHEGEVYVYLEPWPIEGERLGFTLEEMSAQRADGALAPFELTLRDLPGPHPTGQQLLAHGRFAPGSYSDLLITVKAAKLEAAEGPASLLLSAEPTPVEVAFAVSARKAVVIALTFRASTAVQESFRFTPAFTSSLPARPMPQVAGLCTSPASNDVFLFDKHTREVVTVVPTGRGPQGVALSPALNRAYIALSGEDQLEVLDIASGNLLPRIRLAAGDAPRELAVSPDGRTIVVVNRGSNSVTFVDAGSSLELTRTAVGEEPGALLVDRSFRRAYVLNERSSTMTAIDLANRSVVGTVRTDISPLRAQMNRAGTRMYLVHGGSPYMTVYSLPDLAVVNRVFVGLGVSTLKVDSRTDLIYLAREGEGRLSVYDPFAFIPVDYLDVPEAATYMAIDDVDNTLLEAVRAPPAVLVHDLASRRPLSRIEVGEEPFEVIVAGERL